MKTPCVSIIVATYKRNKSLSNALNSLAQQTYKNIEIVVIDDNNDEYRSKQVKEIADDFINKNSSLNFVCIENKTHLGSAETRNVGIRASKGDYITFLDDDDYYLPSKIEEQLAFMIENDLDYSITDLELYDEDGRMIEKRNRNYIKDTSAKSLLTYHLMHHMTGTDTIMFKREYIFKLGCFDPIDVGDEFYLIHKAIEYGGKFGYLPKCSVTAVVHKGEGGLSSGMGKINGENALYEFKKKNFSKLASKNRRYIRMRHNAVLAYAYYRLGKKCRFIIYGIKTFFSAPVQAFHKSIKKLTK